MMGKEGDCNMLVAVNVCVASLRLVSDTHKCIIEKKAIAVLDFF